MLIVEQQEAATKDRFTCSIPIVEHCRRDECRNDGRHRLSSVNCGDCSIEGMGKTADGVKGGFRVVNGVANGMHFL